MVGELVEPCRDRTKLLETGEAPFNHAAVAVDVLGDGGWATAVGSTSSVVGLWLRHQHGVDEPSSRVPVSDDVPRKVHLINRLRVPA